MKEEVFEEILHGVQLPSGVLLSDNSTYRITSNDFCNIKSKHRKELSNCEKILVITHNQEFVVGGILFYGAMDIQATIFPEYRGMHFMSEIHKNGILKSECYPNQKVTISKNTINSFDDFQMKHYLLSCASLKISNLSEIHRYFNMFKPCQRLNGFQEYSLEEFLEKFS